MAQPADAMEAGTTVNDGSEQSSEVGSRDARGSVGSGGAAPRRRSRYRGVTWAAGKRAWRVQMREAGRNVHIGYFDDEAAAARAYDASVRASILAGRRARSAAVYNFPEAAATAAPAPAAAPEQLPRSARGARKRSAALRRAAAAAEPSSGEEGPLSAAAAAAARAGAAVPPDGAEGTGGAGGVAAPDVQTPRRSGARARAASRRSRFKGVTWNAGRAQWLATAPRSSAASSPGAHAIGFFAREADAAAAVDEATRAHGAANAPMNFPRAGERGVVDGDASDYLGVGWDTCWGGWRVHVPYLGVNQHVGVFDDEHCAAAAYNVVVQQLCGADAPQNRIPPAKRARLQRDQSA